MQKAEVQLHDLKFQILIREEQIRTRVKELAAEINQHYKDSKSLLLLGVLNGATYFLADLSREINVTCTVDFARVSSYQGTVSSGIVSYDCKPKNDIKGRDVLIVQDLLDTGLTLLELKSLLQLSQPASLKTCVCFQKLGCKTSQVQVEFVGFKTQKQFLVGYGLDYNQAGRNLKHVYKLKSE